VRLLCSGGAGEDFMVLQQHYVRGFIPCQRMSLFGQTVDVVISQKIWDFPKPNAL